MAGSRLAERERRVAEVCHDLRVPLHAIAGLVECLESSALGEEQRAWVQGMRDATRSALGVAEGLLEEARGARATGSGVDVRREVRSSVELLRRQATERGVAIEVVIEDAVPERVMGAADAVQRIVTNLVSNAIAATVAGSVRVHVARSDGAAETSWLVFEVADTGAGLPEERLQQLLTDPAERPAGGGLGLGIVRELVTSTGGRLEGTSTPGAGSVVTVRLPLQEAPGVMDTDRRASLAGARVLVIDDDRLTRLVLSHGLRAAGAVVEEHGDAASVMTRTSHHGGRADLVVLDVRLADADGIEFAAQVRRGETPLPSSLPIVVLTGDASTEVEARAEAAGVNEVLGKPMSPRALASRVAAWLAGGGMPSRRPTATTSYDLTRLDRITEGDREFRDRLVATFLEQAPALWGAVRAAAGAGDRSRLRDASHRMRSATGVIGAGALHDLLGSLEEPRDEAPVDAEVARGEALMHVLLGELRTLRAATAPRSLGSERRVP